MGTVCTAAPLGLLALGSFGFNVEEQPAAYENARDVLSDSNAFVPVRTLDRATCMDSRLGSNGMRRNLPHMPGGGMTLALMKHFVRGGLMQESSYFHHQCLALQLGVGMVREILREPLGELELLWRLDIEFVDDSALLERLQDWALCGLPQKLLEGAESKEVFEGGLNPMLVAVNCNRPGFTLRQELVVERTGGYQAFSLDMWAAEPVAELLTDDPFERQCLALLYQLLSAGALRRVASPLLPAVLV